MKNGNIVLYYSLYELQGPQTEHTKAKHWNPLPHSLLTYPEWMM